MFLQSRSTIFGRPVCRLSLATRGESELAVDDVHHALARGVNFLNWPGSDDVLSRTIAELGDDWKAQSSHRARSAQALRERVGGRALA